MLVRADHCTETSRCACAHVPAHEEWCSVGSQVRWVNRGEEALVINAVFAP